MRRVLAAAAEPGRTLVAQRMGWQIPLPDGSAAGGSPPRSLAQLALQMRKPVWRVARLEGEALRALLRAARAAPGGGP